MKKTTVNFIRNTALIAVFFALVCVIFIAVSHRTANDGQKAEEISKNVQKLREQENRPTAGGENHQHRIYVTDIPAEQQKILNLGKIDEAKMPMRFRRAVIAGDSIVEAITEYGLLDKSTVFAKIGLSVRDADEMIETLADAQPETVFLCFGLNDMELYLDNAKRFTEDYKKCLEKLQKRLPFAGIFVCSVPTVTPEAVKKTPAYAYRDAYNTALKTMCDEKNISFIDSSFLLRERPKLYDHDGIHPVRSYYPKWLTFLADMAGLEDV